MTPRDLLKSIQSKRIEVCALEDAVLEIQTRLTKVTQTLSDMPRGTSCNDKMTDGVARMIDLKETLNNKIDESCAQERKAIDMINELIDPIFRTILYRLYILNESLEKVSVAINYSYYYTCRMHGYALNEIDKVKINMTSDDNNNRGKVE